MKLSKPSQLLLVSLAGLAAAALLSSCEIITVDYVFVASSAGSGSSSAGLIDVFAADSQSGALRSSVAAVQSGGTLPVSLAVTPNFQNLYVVNQGNSTLVHFDIAANGGLTQKQSIALSAEGEAPASIAVNAAGSALYVVSTQLPGGSAGATLAVFPLASDGTIGSAAANGSLKYWPLTVPGFETDVIVPTGVAVTADGAAVYVSAYDLSAYNPGGSAPSTANPGWVFGFRTGSGGVAAAPSSPFQSGIKPTGLVCDPTNRFVYVTDYASNNLIGFGIRSTLGLSFLQSGPFKTGNEPQAIAIDPRGKYLYVANALDSSVSAYAIDLATGIPSAAVNPTGNATNNTDTQPVAITVDASLGRFVYTANYLGNSVTGFRLNPDTGTLALTQGTPYPSSASPSAIVTVPHGSHSNQAVVE